MFQEPLKNLKIGEMQKSFADSLFLSISTMAKKFDFAKCYGTYDSSGNWATYDSYAIETCID